MKRIIATTLTLLLAGTATAQTQSKEELEFRESQAKKIAAFGAKALKKGFPRKAKLVFLMVISEYDEDNDVARKSLGFTRSGKAWVKDANFQYPKEDKPDPAAANALRKEFEALQKDLVRAHKKMADKYEKAGRTDMAQFHYQRIQRFAPDDPDAKKKLELVDVKDGLSGTGIEQEIYKRAIRIEDAVNAEGSKSYPVEDLPEDNKHPVLERASLSYRSVKSEHFIVRGDYEPEMLKEAAVWAERAYRVIGVAVEGHEQMFLKDTKQWRITQFAFFKQRDSYLQILAAHQSLYKKDMYDFLVEHTTSAAIEDLRFRAAGSKKSVLDGAVRAVAHSYTATRADALTEGLGHTFVGLMLRNNRSFLGDLKEQIGTQTEEDEIDEFNPNMDLWEELALEQAWTKTTTPAVQLPLIHASKLTDDIRIKAWSFCHYALLRNPSFLRYLDMTSEKRNKIDVEQEFTKMAKVSVEQLDKEWKDFFTGATPVMRAIKKRVDPMTAVSPDVKKWLKAINDIRTETFFAAPVNWSSDFSIRCKEHADYLTENKLTGPVEEQRQDPKLPGSSHPGNMFAQMAMVSTNGGNPKKVIEEWMQYPGYRDLFFVNTLKTIGIYADKNTIVMNVVQGLVQPRKRAFYLYPKNGMSRVPNSVKVEDLGPEFAALLQKEGAGDRKVVGFPLSLHFGNSARMPKRGSVECKVTRNDREAIKGILTYADDGSNRRTASPGLIVFYPLEPIKKGSKVKVEWSFQIGRSMERFDATYTH